MKLTAKQMQYLITGLSAEISDGVCTGDEDYESELIKLKVMMKTYLEAVNSLVPNPAFEINAYTIEN